jgi:hypothetical protein
VATRGRSRREFPPDSGFIRIEIQGEWAAHEMSALLADISRLYDIRRDLDLRPTKADEPGLPLPWARIWPSDIQPPSPRLPGPPLAVLRIDDASPGRVDLAGLGKALEQVRLFLEHLIDLIVQRKRRQLEVEGLDQDVVAERIENAQRLLGIGEPARELDLSAEERRALLVEVDDRQQRILEAICEGRVSGVRVLPRPKPPRQPPP